MIGFLLKRCAWLLLTLWTIFSLSFFLMRAVPGGPLDNERQPDPIVRANQEKYYHLDEPVAVQYLRGLWNTARFDLGYSFRLRDFSVNEVIRQGFPISAALGILALTWALLLGTAAGVVAAVRPRSYLNVVLMAAATLGIALPSFVIAGIVLILFVFVWPLFPAAGWGAARQLVLPAFCLGAPYAAYIARLVRTALLEVLGQDYIRTARAKGLPERTVIVRHALRGALLPVVTFLGPAAAGILTGSLVIEQIFFLPGLGVHFIQAATQRDYNLAMGMVLLYSALLLSMNLVVDVLYRVLDPRVEWE
jgi:oligopeptide transport system permease protein